MSVNLHLPAQRLPATAMRLDRGVVVIVAATLTTQVSSLYCYSTAIARVPAMGSRGPDVDKSPATSTLSQALMHLAERLDEPSKDGRIFAALFAAAGLLVVLHTHEYILWHAGVNSNIAHLILTDNLLTQTPI